MEGAAEGDRRRGVAVPAELDDGALRRQQLQRRLKARRGRAGVEDQVAAALGAVGEGEVRAEGGGHGRPARVDVDQRHDDAGDARQQPGHAAADGSGPHDRHPVTDEGPGVPERVDRGLDHPREDGPGDGHVVRHHRDRGGGDDVRRLVGVQAEHRAPEEPGRTVLDHAHVEVAVLHRPGEVAVLEGGAHGVVLAARHASGEDQALGPPAHPRPESAHGDLVGPAPGQRAPADLARARLRHPEGQCLTARATTHATTSRPLPRPAPGEPERRRPRCTT